MAGKVQKSGFIQQSWVQTPVNLAGREHEKGQNLKKNTSGMKQMQ